MTRENIFICGVSVLTLFLPFHIFILWAIPNVSMIKYWKEAIVCAMFLAHMGLSRSTDHASDNRRFFFVWVYVAILFTRTIWDYFLGGDRYLIFYGLYNYVFFIQLAFVSAGISWDTDKTERFFRIISHIISFVSILAVLDWIFELNRQVDLSGLREGLLLSLHVGSGYRAYLGCDNPMELGLYCSVGQVICLYFILEGKKRRPLSVMINWLCFVCCGLGVLSTLSRGPLFANILASSYLFFFRKKAIAMKTNADVFVERASLAILIVILSMSAMLALSDQGVFEHFGAVFDWSEDQANLERVQSWQAGIDKFGDAPLWGNGIGYTQTRLDQYRRLTLKWEDTFISEGFLQVLAVEGGAVLVGGFLLILVHLGMTIRKNTKRCGASRPIFVLLGSLFILFLSESLIMPIFDTRTFVVLFWSVYGITMKLAFPDEK